MLLESSMKFNRFVFCFLVLASFLVVSQSTPLRDPVSEVDRSDHDRDPYRETDRKILEPIVDTKDLEDSKFEIQRRCATFHCNILQKLRLGLGSPRNRYRYRYASHRKIYGGRTRQLRQRNLNYHNQAKRDD